MSWLDDLFGGIGNGVSDAYNAVAGPNPGDPNSRGLGGFLNDYFRARVPRLPTQADYQSLQNMAFGTPAPDGQMVAQGNDANGLTHFGDSSGGLLSNSPFAGMQGGLSQLPASMGVPLLDAFLQNTAKTNDLAPGHILTNATGAQIASNPDETYGEPVMLSDGSFARFGSRGGVKLSQNGPAPKLDFAAPGTVPTNPYTGQTQGAPIGGGYKLLTPEQYGFPPGATAPGTMVQVAPNGQATILKAGDTESQAAINQKVGLAGADAKARMEATNIPLSDQALDTMSDQLLAGDTSVLQGLGYGNVGAQNRAKLRNMVAGKAQARGITGDQLAAIDAEYFGTKAGERTLGNRTANIELANNEFEQVAPLTLQASQAVNRTQFPALNSILQAGERNVGDPSVVRLGQSINSLINVYSRAISPTGTPSVSDKDHARELLSAAWSKGQIAAAIDQMGKEVSAARKAPAAVRQEFRGAITGQGTVPQFTPPSTNGWSVQRVQ